MRFAKISSSLLACLAASCLLPAQTDPCDPNLRQPDANPYSYRLRGNRCEGIYVQPVSAAPLLIASWTESFPDYSLSSQQPLVVEWDVPISVPVRVRAQGLRYRLYYRMDARCAGAAPFNWPSGLLSALKISRRELGVTAVARAAVAGTERDVYLPVRVRQGVGGAIHGPYKLVVVPGVELNELFVSLSAAGSGHRMLKEGEPVGYGYYPAERAIEIPVSVPHGSGFYHLEIGATHKSGASSTAELWFYHQAGQEQRK